MFSKWTRRLGLLALGSAVVYGSVGCAEERSPINRVQANALDKHFFVGANLSDPKDDPEFYQRNTVVDVPYGAAQAGLFTASYAQPVNRIKWEISENALIARETYERIVDSDYKGSRKTDNGQVVAMFNISSHFDIKRAYNTTTGEELNVVEENTTDRPWYEREFMRVDWSKNLVTDGYMVDTLSQIGVFGGIQWDPMAYYVGDPNDQNAPQFVENEGYFDVTTKAYATPKVVDDPFEPGNKVPCCFYPGEYGGSWPIGNCNPTEVTLRLSFRKVVDNDFEPSDWTGQRMDAFGWFTVDRYGYDRNYGVLDEKWHRFAAKYNIWQQSHVSNGAQDPAERQYAQCATDFWRDGDGNVAKYRGKKDSQGNVQILLDAKTRMPIPTTDDDPNGGPYAWTPVGGDVHRDTNHDGTEDECEVTDENGDLQPYTGQAGARCDEFSNRCSMPLRNRALKTLPWYYGADSPPDLFASTANALGQWNLAVKRSAQIGKMVDARRVGADDSGFLVSEDDLANDKGVNVPEVFVLCHNPTLDEDHPACRQVAMKDQAKCMVRTNGNGGDEACNWGGPKDTKNERHQVYARLGDLRYNLVNIINTPQQPSPWGIMVDADDPTTGEKVATSVNEWGHVLDIASQGTEDLLRWINGEISDAQIMSGQYLRDWVGASKLGTSQHQPAVLETQEIQTRLRSIDTSISKLNGISPAQGATMRPELRRLQAAKNLAANLGPSLDGQFEAFRHSIIGSPWEAQLASPEWLQAAGYDPRTPAAGNDQVIAGASTFRGFNPELQRKVNMLRGKTLAQNASCVVDQPEPDSLVGMARQAQKLYPLPDTKDPNYPALKYQRDKALHQWIREQFHISVIAHEMGHSMGLRHNFTGSFDALNYHPEYWQLRTRNNQEHFCTSDTKFDPNNSALDPVTSHTNGADCVGPRWIDPVTDTEVNGLIWKWASTTVMDYPGDQTQDMNGIGLYDKAAMRFGYADVVDVDNDAKYTGGPKGQNGDRSTKGGAYIFALDGFGGIGGRSLGGNHYSTYNDKYHIIRNCTPPTDPNNPLSAKCDSFDLDYVALRDMKAVDQYDASAAQVLPFLRSNFAIDAKNRVRHPYMFGSDEFADFGNVPVFRFDAGADSYEQFQFLISTYENRYIFDNFRRDRTLFNSRMVISRFTDRYFDKIQGITKSLAFLTALETNPIQAISDPGNLMPMSLGASDGLAMFARIMTRPEPGPYATTDATDPSKALPFAALEDINGQINLPNGQFRVAAGSGEGRYLHNDYDYTQGYYWSDYQLFAGSSYEKHIAVRYLAEAYNHFLSNQKEDYIDGRYKNVNYATLYPNQIRRLFSQVLQNDPQTFAPYVVPPTLGVSKDNVARIRYLPWEKYDETVVSTVNLDYSQDAVILDPLVGWEQQYRMLLDVFWFGPTTLTMDVIDQVRIFSPGDGGTIQIDPNEQVQFKDPGTGTIYVSRTFGQEMINAKSARVERSMGARMIQFANHLAAQTWRIDARDPKTGLLTYTKDANGQLVCADDALCVANSTKLKGYVANLDVVRQLTRQYGYGPLGHGER
jgi:hypothetical protein